jgi:hypothetical protein
MSSISAMRLLFQAGSRVISGNLAGKFLNCTMRPPQGGALPPAGDYQILAPMNDPIYGRVALMVSVGGSGAVDVGLTLQKCLVAVGAASRGGWDVTVNAKALKPDVRSTAMSNRKMGMPDASPPGQTSGQVFVLSNKPVLGRNCVVVSSGFADLMDGLQAAGGARVTVV